MYPNLFVIGAAKSGTSALHYYLAQHPEVHMCEPKEPHFFSRSPDGRWPLSPPLSDAQYQRLFNTQRPVRGESSVTYSFWPYPAGVPERIHAIAPDARFIYVVRDPVDRSLAHYHHRVGLGTEHRSLAEVLAAPNDAEERYLAASRYATQIEQYLACFPQERMLVVDHHELLTDRHAVLRHAFGFLGVDPAFTSERFSVQVNPSSEHRRFSSVGSMISNSRPYRTATAWIRPDVRRRLIRPFRLALSRPVPQAQVTDAMRAQLAETLAPEARRLRALTGKDFPTWSV